MCTQNADDVIQTCSECTVAPKTFTVSFGAVIGTKTFVYVSGCTWETANFTVYYVYPTGGGGSTAGVYKGTFVEAGTSSTLDITFVSGTDTMKLSTARALSWKPDPDKFWSCICNMTMIPAVSPERFPPNLFAPCEACVAPVDATAASYADCGYLATNELCIDSVTMAAVDLSAAGGIQDCTLTTLTDEPLATQSNDPTDCCFSLSGKPYSAAIGYYELIACSPSGASMYQAVQVCVDATTGTLTVTVTIGQGYPAAIYIFEATYTAVGPVAVGANTVTYVSSAGYSTTGGGAITDATWPATLTIKASHCLFGDTNGDYGYGCGGGSTDCSGLCTAVSEVGASPTGFVWTFTGADPSNCVGASCICQTIDQITSLFGYPPSLGATAGAPCVSS